MGLPNKDEIEGKYEEAKGIVKEVIGKTAGDQRLEQNGIDQQNAGIVQNKVGKGFRKVGEAVENLGKKIKK